jgi:membrane protein required for colicin V production
MNWLDMTLICLAIVGFIKGCMDGFVRQIIAFVALIAALYLCSNVAESLRGYLLQTAWFPEYGVTMASYVLAFLLIGGVILLVGGMLHKMINLTPLSVPNHLAGGIFGLVVTVLFLSLTLNILDSVDRRSMIISHETKVESLLYLQVREIGPALYPVELFIWKK